MSKTENNRVLTRRGARELTREELDQIAGSLNTFASNTGTGTVSSSDCDFDQ